MCLPIFYGRAGRAAGKCTSLFAFRVTSLRFVNIGRGKNRARVTGLPLCGATESYKGGGLRYNPAAPAPPVPQELRIR